MAGWPKQKAGWSSRPEAVSATRPVIFSTATLLSHEANRRFDSSALKGDLVGLTCSRNIGQISIFEMAQEFFSKNLSAPGYTPIFGCCCLIGSLFFEWPQYCGSNGSCVVSCWESGFTCCQPVNKQDPRKDCIILDNYCHFGTTNTYELIKIKNQCFCFDFRAALPTDEGNPCLINICGLNLCKNWKKNIKCCRKLSELH